MEKTKLESMQIVAKQKRMAAKQAELEALEVEKDVEAIKLEIEVTKRKGFIEEIFWRFPHIGEQILQKVDSNTLSKCLEINKLWKEIVFKKKICQINQLEKHTYIKSSILKKLLANKDFETIQKLANYSIKVYTKVIVDRGNNNAIDNDYRKHQDVILCYLFAKKHRDKIQHLLTELMLKNTIKKYNQGNIKALIQMGDFELLQMYFENFKNKMDHENYRKLVFEFLLLSPPWRMVECIQRINNQKGRVFTTTPSYQSLSCLYGCQKEAKVSLSVILEAGKGPFKYYVIIRLGGWVQKMAIFAYYQYRKSPKTLHILSFFSITSQCKGSFNN